MLSDRVDGSLNVKRGQAIMARAPQESSENLCKFPLIIDDDHSHQQPSWTHIRLQIKAAYASSVSLQIRRQRYDLAATSTAQLLPINLWCSVVGQPKHRWESCKAQVGPENDLAFR